MLPTPAPLAPPGCPLLFGLELEPGEPELGDAAPVFALELAVMVEHGVVAPAAGELPSPLPLPVPGPFGELFPEPLPEALPLPEPEVDPEPDAGDEPETAEGGP